MNASSQKLTSTAAHVIIGAFDKFGQFVLSLNFRNLIQFSEKIISYGDKKMALHSTRREENRESVGRPCESASSY